MNLFWFKVELYCRVLNSGLRKSCFTIWNYSGPESLGEKRDRKQISFDKFFIVEFKENGFFNVLQLLEIDGDFMSFSNHFVQIWIVKS